MVITSTKDQTAYADIIDAASNDTNTIRVEVSVDISPPASWAQGQNTFIRAERNFIEGRKINQDSW